MIHFWWAFWEELGDAVLCELADWYWRLEYERVVAALDCSEPMETVS